MIYLNDHVPPHVHVIGPDSKAVFNLNCAVGAVRLREQVGLKLSQKRAIAVFLNGHLESLCKAWEEIHGK